LFAVLLVTQGLHGAARAVAQAPAPASADASDTGDEVSEKQMAKDEEAGENAFRHSPVIKSLARTLHLDVEKTARIFEILNIAIVVLGIGIPLYRIVPKYLRDRAARVSSDIDSARKQTEQANSRLSAVEAGLAHLDDEIARYRAEMEAQSRVDEERIKASIVEESARIVTAAEQEIGVAAAQARRGLRHFAAELAIDQAARQITLTPETDRALIAEFVSNAGKGGAN
jgi:F-type H+-transporting ATPase subunit b